MALSKIDTDGVSGLQASLTATTTVPSEGGAVTTNLVQGLAKAWARIDQNDTPQLILGSFNVTSVTDGGSGETSVNFNNNMNDSFWCGTAVPGSSNRFVINNAPNTTRLKIETYSVSGQTANDSTDVYGVVHGDLA